MSDVLKKFGLLEEENVKLKAELDAANEKIRRVRLVIYDARTWDEMTGYAIKPRTAIDQIAGIVG